MTKDEARRNLAEAEIDFQSAADALKVAERRLERAGATWRQAKADYRETMNSGQED